MPSYSNGYVPLDLMVRFRAGRNNTDGDWHHSLPPSTYRKHLALVQRAKDRTGRTLAISEGWGAYRPYDAQVIARRVFGNGAAVPGTSSHGGFWEGRQTMAMDYGNWSWVYGGDRNAFAADCRAVGLTPNMITPARGYPDEPWHVIDTDPWAPVPAGGNPTPLEGFLMALSDAQQRQMYEVIVAPKKRQGGKMGGDVTLEGIIQWFDHNMIALTERLAAIQSVTNTDLPRQGGAMEGTTSLKAFLQWADQNFIAVQRKVDTATEAILAEVKKNGATVDEAVLRSAVSTALEGALGGTTLDPEVTAKAVRAEFRNDPVK